MRRSRRGPWQIGFVGVLGRWADDGPECEVRRSMG